MAMVCVTIAEEVGIPLEDLTVITNLLELGVGSLLFDHHRKINQLDIELPSNLPMAKHILQGIDPAPHA